jgi:hypothetical protein
MEYDGNEADSIAKQREVLELDGSLVNVEVGSGSGHFQSRTDVSIRHGCGLAVIAITSSPVQ